MDVLENWRSKSGLFRNSVYNGLSVVSFAFFGFLFWFIGTRLYSPSDIGSAQLLISSMLGIVALSSLGFNVSLLSFFPKEREKAKLLGTCIVVSTIISVLASLLFAFFLKFFVPSWNASSGVAFIFSFVIITASWTIGTIFDTFLVAVRESKKYFLRSTIISAVKVASLFLVFFGSQILFLSWGIASILSLAIMFYYLSEEHKASFSMHFSTSHLLKILPLSIGNYLSWGFNYIVALVAMPILAIHYGFEQVGYFGIAWNVAAVIFLIPVSISQVLISEASNSPENMRLFIIKAMKYSLLFLVPALAFMVFFSSPVLGFFGRSYASASGVLTFLVYSAVPLMFVSIYSAIKNIIKHAEAVLWMNVIRLLTFTVVSFLLIPVQGMFGIAWAWMLGNLVACPLTVYEIYRVVKHDAQAIVRNQPI